MSETGNEGDGRTAPLLDEGDLDELGGRWRQIQTAFVDDPRAAVTDAHKLVGDVMQRLSQTFARERDGLEEQWAKDGDPSTEELRVALQRYRSFFERLLQT